MSAVSFTLSERSSLLRAARKEADRLKDDIVRLHTLDGTEEAEALNRQIAAYAEDELRHLQAAIRKIWIASGE